MNNEGGISKIGALILVAAVIAAGFGVQWWFKNRYYPAKRGEIPSAFTFRLNPETKSSAERRSTVGAGSSSSVNNCTALKGVARVSCVTKAAESSKSVAGCNSLSVSNVGLEAARDYCLSRVASRSGNAQICRSVNNEQLRSECYLGAASASGDGNACKSIGDFELREDCYVAVAVKTLDLRYCSHIQTRERKDVCNALALPYKKDPLNLCASKTTEKLKDNCYREAAVARQDLSLCSKIADRLDNISCVTALAQMRNSREVCDTIQDSFFVNTCYDAIKTFRN